MAAQISLLTANSQHPNLLEDFIDAFDSVQAQLSNGVAAPQIPLTKISSLGEDGVAILKKHIESTTKANFMFTANAGTNSIVLTPLGPMPSKQAATAVPGKQNATSKNAKVPRPANAFIIYRREWHSTVVAENPHLQNNDISVIIGSKWKDESEEVKGAYKLLAEEAKRQHAVDHPGYQYQPRKPSEKKKRMTKNKLAKLAAKARANGDTAAMQQTLSSDFDPLAMLDDNLAAAAAAMVSAPVQTFTTPYSELPPALGHASIDGWLAFDSSVDLEETLRAQLLTYNADYPRTTPPTSTTLVSNPIMDGQLAQRVMQHALPGISAYSANVTTSGSGFNHSAASIAPEQVTYLHTAEVGRQRTLDEVDFTGFVDLEGFAEGYTLDLSEFVNDSY